jgi:hypothetical protein
MVTLQVLQSERVGAPARSRLGCAFSRPAWLAQRAATLNQAGLPICLQRALCVEV